MTKKLRLGCLISEESKQSFFFFLHSPLSPEFFISGNKDVSPAPGELGGHLSHRRFIFYFQRDKEWSECPFCTSCFLNAFNSQYSTYQSGIFWGAYSGFLQEQSLKIENK